MSKLTIIPSGRTGFTIIEILVALAIFAIGVLGMAKLSTYLAVGGSYNNQVSNAISMAHNDLEYIASLNAAGVASSLGVGNVLTRPLRTSQGINYNSSIVISAVTGNTVARNATVTITWINKTTPHRMQMSLIK